MYCRNIIYSNAPLLKAYRYKDAFQLVPIFYASNAPFSYYAAHFPAFLEYQINDTMKEELMCEEMLRENGIPEDAIKKGRLLPQQSRIRSEILYLLSALTNFHFFEYTSGANCWGIQTPMQNINELSATERKEINNQISHWTIRCYSYPTLKEDLQISNFTNCTSYYENTEDPISYFTNNPHSEGNTEIKVPPYFNFVLDRYFSMNVDDRNWVRQCIGLLNDGIDLFDRKRSVSLLSIISSIEGMALLDYKKYGKAKNLGPKNRFLRYLRTYVAGKSEEKFKRYYKKRCEITHEGVLFLGDIDIFSDPQYQNGDWLLRLEIMQVARLALYNWLRRKL